jgi:hypothetical protein
MSWQKIGESDAAKGVAVVVMAIGVLWAYATWDEPAQPGPAPTPAPSAARAAPLQVIASIDGVQLGDKLADAASARGPFDRQKDAPLAERKYPDEQTHVQRNGGRLRLLVRAGTVFVISYSCKDDRDPAALNRVGCRDKGDGIRRVFGDRLRVLCANVKPGDPRAALAPFARAYDAVEFGTRYVVVKDQVRGFMIATPAELASMVGFTWVKCV